MLAKNERAAAMLSAVFSQHKAEKHYLATVSGTPDPTKGEMRDLLFHDRRCNKSFIVRRARRGAKEALLEYSPAKHSNLAQRSTDIALCR